MKNLQLLQSMATLFENVEKFVGRFGAKHCDAGLAEVRQAFENRRCCKMPTVRLPMPTN